MVRVKTTASRKTLFLLCFTLLARAEKLLNSEEILRLYPPTDDGEQEGEAIERLMPNGGYDVDIDGRSKERLMDAAPLKRLRPVANISLEQIYAPSDESFDHFSRMAAGEYTMEDVMNYERQNDIRQQLWPKNVIPYEFDDKISNDARQRNVVYAAMSEWEAKTCLKFQPFSLRLSMKLGHVQRVRIDANLEDGCWSRVGMQGQRWGTPQTLTLETNAVKNRWLTGCFYHSTVLHEIGHTIGYYHEQARLDRDKYLDVYRRNIQTDSLPQFIPMRYVLMDQTPYDYLSIMHYSKTSFGKVVNGKTLTTMLPKNRCYTDHVGRQKNLSYYDHKAVNLAYGCARDCGRLSCAKDCYATKSGENKKCHCVCWDHGKDPCWKDDNEEKKPNEKRGKKPRVGTKKEAKAHRCTKEKEHRDCAKLVASLSAKRKGNYCSRPSLKKSCCYSCSWIDWI